MSFKRAVGAPADVKELEYISALHQTCLPETRENGTVSSLDVQRMLVSRHGVEITHSQAIDIVRGLGGGIQQPLITFSEGRGSSKITLLLSNTTRFVGTLSTGAVKAAGSVGSKTANVGSKAVGSVAGVGSKAGSMGSKAIAGFKSATSGSKVALHERSSEAVKRGVAAEEPTDGTEGAAESTDGEEAASASDSFLGSVFCHKSAKREVEEDDRTGADKKPSVNFSVDNGKVPTVSRKIKDPLQVISTLTGLSAKEEFIPEEYLDLVQLAAILLIPVLCRAATQIDDVPPALGEEEPKDPPAPTSGRYAAWRHKKHMEKIHYHRQREQQLQPPKNLLQDVLELLLKDIYDSTTSERSDGPEDEAPILDEELVQALLRQTGEFERSQNPQLLREMVAVAQSQSGRLDVEAFAAALTSDLTAWDVGSEDRQSTLFYDVFGKQHRAGTLLTPATSFVEEEPTADQELGDVKDTEKIAQAPADHEMGNVIDSEKNVGNSRNSEEKIEGKTVAVAKSVLKGAGIDYVIDMHTSVLTLMCIWFLFVFMSFTYGSLFQSIVSARCAEEGDTSFGCTLLSVLWTWFVVAAFLALFGVAVVYPLSWGNDPSARSPRRMIFAILLTAAYSIIPYIIVMDYINEDRFKDDAAKKRANSPFFEPELNVTFVIGMIVIALFAVSLVGAVVDKRKKEKKGSENYLLSTSLIIGESRIKQAATRKINKWLTNAISLHEPDETMKAIDRSLSVSFDPNQTQKDQAMLNYVLHGQKYETTGGLIWTWRQIFSRQLFDTEGIWFPSRVVVFQGAQLLIAIVLAIFLGWVTMFAADQAEKAEDSLAPDLPSWVYALVPNRREVNIALWTAFSVSVLVMLTLTSLYLPSVCATILLYRSGDIPSLGSRYFLKYRTAVDTAYMNVGNAIYGLIGSAALFFFIIGLIIFLFIWDFSRKLMITLLAWGLGLTITISLKMMLTKTLRRTTYKSFYRTRPHAANLSTLALECWWIGLGGSVLIARIGQFLFAAVFWVGRIDVPFLSEDVSLMGYSFDYVPTNFVKDLLVHEAHRHPFLERLAQMYLMKLKHKDFGSGAGAVWRQLFVQALMPWLRKHRVFAKARIRQAISALSARKLQAEEDEKGLAERFAEDIMDLGEAAMGTAAVGAGATVERTSTVGEEVADQVLTVAENVTGHVMGVAEGLTGRIGGTRDSAGKPSSSEWHRLEL